MTESAKDRQLGPLASFVRAAEPLEELTAGERERIRHRLQAALYPSHRPAVGFRWSTVLAALGLLLAGGVVFAAAGHFGLIPWPREDTGSAASRQPARRGRARCGESLRRRARLPLRPSPFSRNQPSCRRRVRPCRRRLLPALGLTARLMSRR
jgi:hypothetical protein